MHKVHRLCHEQQHQLFIVHGVLDFEFGRKKLSFSYFTYLTYFFSRIKYISRFLRLNACLARCIIRKQCVSQQNVINKLEAERVDLQFLFYYKFCNYAH